MNEKKSKKVQICFNNFLLHFYNFLNAFEISLKFCIFKHLFWFFPKKIIIILALFC